MKELIDDIKWFRPSSGWLDSVIYGLGPVRFSALVFLGFNLWFVYGETRLSFDLSLELLLFEGVAWLMAWGLGEFAREDHERMRAARKGYRAEFENGERGMDILRKFQMKKDDPAVMSQRLAAIFDWAELAAEVLTDSKDLDVRVAHPAYTNVIKEIMSGPIIAYRPGTAPEPPQDR